MGYGRNYYGSKKEMVDASAHAKIDVVNSPPHYNNDGEIECIDAIEASMAPLAFSGYLKGNVLKYLWRYEKKGGAQDLNKANWYLTKLTEIATVDEFLLKTKK